MRVAGDPLDRLLDERLPFRDALSERFLPSLLGAGPGVAAVVYYGSCLAGAGAADSEPDFFLVVDALAAHLPRLRERVLGRVLPPLTFRRVIEGGRACKVCVVEAAQLRRETSPRAADLHHLGRFSKRLGLVYARDEAAHLLVREAQRSSLEILADRALALLGERFSLDGFLLVLLGLSYRGEPRVVEPGKVEGLFLADRDDYRRIGRLLLETRAATAGGDLYEQPAPTEPARRAAERLIARSRRRALLRWPKNMLTFDDWGDYVVRKVERHTGRALDARARRHPLVYGWPQLVALRRDGLLR